MNLAEIRKKAQQGETQRQQDPAHGASAQAPGQAASAAQPEPSASAAQPCDQAPPRQLPAVSCAASATAPVAADYQWQEEPLGEDFPEDLLLYPEPGDFDPASVILKGRLSSSFEEGGGQEEQGAASTLELLCFKVADEEYAISIMDIKEIMKPREVTEVPRAPEFVRGILSLRGIIIPIFDIRVRLGLDAGGDSGKERVIVVKRQNGCCGVLVDEVVQVVRVPSAGIEPPPAVLDGIDREFVAGIGRVAGRMLILLDMEKVLDVALL
jgi:purine-binding chemotaxis protein CheW